MPKQKTTTSLRVLVRRVLPAMNNPLIVRRSRLVVQSADTLRKLWKQRLLKMSMTKSARSPALSPAIRGARRVRKVAFIVVGVLTVVIFPLRRNRFAIVTPAV